MNLPLPGLAPIDGARAALLRSLGAPGRALLRDPSLRVVLYGLIGVLFALASTCAAPAHTFALAPLVLGIPHLLADVRYLVMRPRLHERKLLILAAGAPLALSTVMTNPAYGLSASVIVTLLARGTVARRALVAVVAGSAAAAAAMCPQTAALVIAHLHNAVGAVFVLAVFSRRRWLEAIPVAAFALVSLAIVLGLFDGALLRPFATHEPTGAEPLEVTISRYAPVDDPVLGIRLVALFVFAQGVHYVAWLRLVPELARERRGIRSFSSSVRALTRDLDPVTIGVALAAAASIVFLAGTRSLADARNVYLGLASFHGPLEIAALALVAVEGRATLAARPC